jgi:hypothetical protein
MKKYKCEKHGFLEGHERVSWSREFGKRWCMHCMNEFMDKNFTPLVEVEMVESDFDEVE